MTEAELLFSDILGCSRSDLYLEKDRRIGRPEAALISQSLTRRVKGEPVQYILGKTEFMGLEIKVNKDVLIPRPETEILAETVLEYAQKEKAQRVLDLGTGSGCIAISLVKYLTDFKIDASDVSDKALEVARENAKLNNAKINFIQSDLFASHKLQALSYDIIVSNPPYIAEGEIKKLQPELQFEPTIALSGGYDGLGFYRRIIPESGDYLRENGLLIIEIGYNQRHDLEKIFDSLKLFEILKVVKDYNNIERVIVARKV